VEENDVRSRLRNLMSDDSRRSATARLRDVFDDVEAALRKGFSLADVLGELNQAGFQLSMPGFKSALQRIRQERILNRSPRGRQAASTSPRNAQQPPAPTRSPALPTEPRPAPGYRHKAPGPEDEKNLI
jgi:hypothetical protein